MEKRERLERLFPLFAHWWRGYIDRKYPAYHVIIDMDSYTVSVLKPGQTVESPYAAMMIEPSAIGYAFFGTSPRTPEQLKIIRALSSKISRYFRAEMNENTRNNARKSRKNFIYEFDMNSEVAAPNLYNNTTRRRRGSRN